MATEDTVTVRHWSSVATVCYYYAYWYSDLEAIHYETTLKEWQFFMRMKSKGKHGGILS